MPLNFDPWLQLGQRLATHWSTGQSGHLTCFMTSRPLGLSFHLRQREGFHRAGLVIVTLEALQRRPAFATDAVRNLVHWGRTGALPLCGADEPTPLLATWGPDAVETTARLLLLPETSA